MSWFLGNLARRLSFTASGGVFLRRPTVATTTKPTSKRWIASPTTRLGMPLDEFRDSVSREKRATETVGRPWSVKELRRKSYHDLHKLWYVLYKEKNMLLTEANLSRRKGIRFPQPERSKKVKKGMAAIKAVLGERKREKLAQHALKMAERKKE